MAVYLGSNEVNLRGGQPMENGLPSGGLTGQMLAKSSNDDYVAAWTTVYDVPAGGSMGQVLAKSSDDDYALTWISIESDPALPSGGLNGQVLAKSSNDDYAVAWSTLPPGEFVITVTQTSTTGSGVFSMNKTIAQIEAAIESGQHVVIYFKFTAYSQFSEPGNLKRFPYKRTAYGYYEFENDFIDINSGYTELCSYLFKINTSSGAISLTRESAYGVAAGSSRYVGKFLGAAAGVAVPMYPEWQTIYQVPAGGSSGQFLKKTGSGSADYAWASVPSGLPSGGTAGQVLKKNSGTDYDVTWADASGGGGESDLLFCEVDSTQHTSSMTPAEIAAAIAAGKKVMLVVVDPGRGKIVGGIFNAGDSDAGAQALYIDEQMSWLIYYSVYVTEEQAEVYTITYTLTPVG